MRQALQEQQCAIYRQIMDAQYAAIDRVCAAVMARFLARADRRDQFIVRLLLSEALTNAVRHGCAGCEAQQITCEAWMTEKRLHLRVTDPGPGFDWQAMLCRRVQALQCHGHGLEIIQLYAAAFAYNAAGNQLTLTYTLTGEYHDNL